jgi:hypothetical protein
MKIMKIQRKNNKNNDKMKKRTYVTIMVHAVMVDSEW